MTRRDSGGGHLPAGDDYSSGLPVRRGIGFEICPQVSGIDDLPAAEKIRGSIEFFLCRIEHNGRDPAANQHHAAADDPPEKP